MAYILEVKYYNSLLVRKVMDINQTPFPKPVWPGLPWNPPQYPSFPGEAQTQSSDSIKNWFVEESRIKGGYNNPSVSLGVRAYLNEENPNQEYRSSSLIYSGVFNSRTGINNTNVFSIGESITKDLNPKDGSVQKLFAEDTNLNIFQQQKCSYILINKNTIYSGTQGAAETQGAIPVLGQVVPYLGKYGISEYPNSFGFFGNRKYFVDTERQAVLRLSRDGLTEISNYGMKDYFRDTLANLNIGYKPKKLFWKFKTGQTFNQPVSTFDITFDSSINSCDIFKGSIFQVNGDPSVNQQNALVNQIVDNTDADPPYYTITLNQPIAITGNPTLEPEGYLVYYYKSDIVANWDNYSKNYTVSIQKTPSYVESEINYSTLSFDERNNGWISFYGFKPSFLFSRAGKFYSTTGNYIYQHNIGAPGVFYERKVNSNISFVFNTNPSTNKNFQTVSYEGSNGWFISSFTGGTSGPTIVDPINQQTSASAVTITERAAAIPSYNEGYYSENGRVFRGGFNRKENYYVSNLLNNTPYKPEQVLSGEYMTGIKGYYANVTIATDSTTSPNAIKELWAVGTTFVRSS